MGDPNWMGDRASRSPTSSVTRSSQSRSTRSDLVTTGMPSGTPRCSRTERCSSVCGMIPSSAATTSSARSTPDAPATMVRTKSSWPGTSTTPAITPLARSRAAKLRSIVIPRRRSSASRSIARPLSAVTSADFPWSMCPAVPMIMRPPRVDEARTRARAAPPPHRGGSGCSGRAAAGGTRRDAGRAAAGWRRDRAAPQIGAGVGRELRGAVALRARGTERASLAGAEREPTLGGQQASVPDAGIELGREAERAHQPPEGPEAERLELHRGDDLEFAQGVAKQVVALGMRIGRGEVQHDLGERGGGGVALEIGGQAHVQAQQVEAARTCSSRCSFISSCAWPSLRGWRAAPNRLLGRSAPLAMALWTPCSRVASRTIFEVSLYRMVDRTIAGVSSWAMRRNIPASLRGRR